MPAYAALYQVVLAAVCEAQEAGWRTVAGTLLPPAHQGGAACVPAPEPVVLKNEEFWKTDNSLITFSLTRALKINGLPTEVQKVNNSATFKCGTQLYVSCELVLNLALAPL